jgi:tape measure domain-containing protein
MAKELGASSAEINFMSKAMTGAANKVQQLGNRLATLSNQNKNLRDKVASLEAALKRSTASMNNNSAALMKQKRAAASVEQQFKNLFQKMRQVGASEQALNGLTQSFNRFRKQMQSGVLTANQFSNAMISWGRATGNARRGLDAIRFERKTKAISQFNRTGFITKDMLSDMASSAILTFGPLSGVGSRIIALLAIFKRGNAALIAWTLGLTATLAVLGKVAIGSIKAGLEIQKIETMLKSVTDTTFEAEEQFRFLASTALDLGLEISSTGRSFASMISAGTNAGNSISQVQALFTEGAGAAKVLGLSVEETGRMFKAFEQIMSKGVVQSEEIKQQLGDVLPGALSLTAKAFGVTTSQMLKMMEQGEATSDQFVAKFAQVLKEEFGRDLPAATRRLDSEWVKFTQTLKLAGAEIDEVTGLSKILAGALRSFTLGAKLFVPAVEGAGDLKARLMETTSEVKRLEAALERLGEGGMQVRTRGNMRGGNTAALEAQLVEARARQQQILSSMRERGGVSGPTRDLRDLKNAFDLPIEKVDKFRNRISNLNAQLAILRDTSIEFKTRVKMAEELDNQQRAAEKATTIFKGLTVEQRKAFALQQRIPDTVEGVKAALQGLVLAELNAKDAVREASKEMKDQKKTLTDLEKQTKSFNEAMSELTGQRDVLALRTSGQSDAAEALKKQLEFRKQFPLLGEKDLSLWMQISKEIDELNELLKEQNKIRSQRENLASEIRDLKVANDIVTLRIRGEKELADQLQTRFDLAKKFPSLSREELAGLEVLLNRNKELSNVLKEQEELQKVRRELAEDFANTIGQAFEDAVIEGEKLSDVLQALLDDINRIILRVLVTKPLENFLTGALTGEDLTGSKAGPGGTPFFGGALGKFFSEFGSGSGSTTSRPLKPGESIPGLGGSVMTEFTAGVNVPGLNKGLPTVIPTIWNIGGKPTVLTEQEAGKLATEFQNAAGSGVFPFFESFGEADAFARARSAAGGIGSGPLFGGGREAAIARGGMSQAGRVDPVKSLEELAEASKTATSASGALTRNVVGLTAEKLTERVTTSSLTGSLFEFQVAVRLATQALQAMATGIGAGAGSGAASGGIAGLSSILNFSSSFGGDAGLPFGGQPPPFVPGFGFVGPRQHGGPTGPNSPVLVGEAGPEVFVPNRAGRIEPMPRGERPIIVNQTMNVRSEDDPGFRRSARSNLRLLGRSAKSSLRGV